MEIAKCPKYPQLQKVLESKYKVDVKAALRVRSVVGFGEGGISMRTIGWTHLLKWIDMAPATLKGRVYYLCSLNGGDFWNGRVVLTALWTEVFHLWLKPLFLLLWHNTDHHSWEFRRTELISAGFTQVQVRYTSKLNPLSGKAQITRCFFSSFSPLVGGLRESKFSRWEQSEHLGVLGFRRSGKCSW